jgi:hypothetical protein
VGSDGPLKPPKREELVQLPVRVANWQFAALCRRAQARGVGLGEVLRAILDGALATERTS